MTRPTPPTPPRRPGRRLASLSVPVQEANVQLEYLLVTYSSAQSVAADDMLVGITNHILMLQPGDYTIALNNVVTVPVSVDISLDGTSVLRPCVVAFT